MSRKNRGHLPFASRHFSFIVRLLWIKFRFQTTCFLTILNWLFDVIGDYLKILNYTCNKLYFTKGEYHISHLPSRLKLLFSPREITACDVHCVSFHTSTKKMFLNRNRFTIIKSCFVTFWIIFLRNYLGIIHPNAP